jgi:TP901 family phage tail tape measure protein
MVVPAQRAEGALNKLKRSTKSAGDEVQRLDQKFDKLHSASRMSQLKKLGTFLGIGLNAAILINFGKAATQMAVTFESEMSKVVNLVGVSRASVNAMSDDVLKMAGEVGRSPQELAEGLFFVTSAGFRGKEALDVLRASAQAAAAGMGETKVVADAATSAVNAYGAANLSAEKAVGILVATVREGKAAAEEISAAIGPVIGVAEAAGVEFAEVGATLAALTRVGINAAEATTALKSTISAIISPAEKQEQMFKKVGLSSEQLQKSLRDDGLIETLHLLKEAAKGDLSVFTTMIPNIRALTGVFSLVGANADIVREIFAALAKETGQSLKTAFEGVTQDTMFKFQQASASLKAELIKLGAEALPSISKGIAALTKAIPYIVGGLEILLKTTIDIIKYGTPLAAFFLAWTKGVVAIKAMNAALIALNSQHLPATIALMISGTHVGNLFAASMHKTALGIKATGAALLTLKGAMGVLIAALAGWQIGSWLYENVRGVRLFAAATIAAFDEMWTKLQGTTQRFMLRWKIAWNEVLAWLLEKFAGFYGMLANVADYIPGFGDVAASWRSSTDLMRERANALTGSVASLQAQIEESKVTQDAATAAIQAATDDYFRYEMGIRSATAALKDQQDQNEKPKPKPKPTALAPDPEAATALQDTFSEFLPDVAEAERLAQQLKLVDSAIAMIDENMRRGFGGDLLGRAREDWEAVRIEIQKAQAALDPHNKALEELREQYDQLIEANMTPLEEFNRKREELLQLERMLISAYPELADQIEEYIRRANKAAGQEYVRLTESETQMSEGMKRLKFLAENLGMSFASAFEDAIVEAKSFSDVLKGLEQDIIRILVRMFITQPLTEGIGNMFPGRARGGKVLPGQAYVVGEKGPEIFMEDRMGRIFDNETSAELLAREDRKITVESEQKAFEPKIENHIMLPPQKQSTEPVTVNVPETRIEIINMGGADAPQPQVQTQRQPDGSQLIKVLVNAMTSDIAQDGPMSRALRAKYGLRNVMAQR